MDEADSLARRFQEDRTRLRAIAYRILGSLPDAEDALQEAWIRVSRADTRAIDNLPGYLTTVVARVALNMLQSRTTRREDPRGASLPDDTAGSETATPEEEALVADALGPALVVVLDTLSPAERLAFVLHDLFAVPFEEVAGVLGKSPAAARQLASRARRRVQGAEASDPDRRKQREIVAAFLAASREGRFADLLALLDPDVVLHADAATVLMGGQARVAGALDVANTFSGRARAAHLAVLDGDFGAVWFVNGEPKVAFAFVTARGRITAIEMIADTQTLAETSIELA